MKIKQNNNMQLGSNVVSSVVAGEFLLNKTIK
jgi:hypothetical protein